VPEIIAWRCRHESPSVALRLTPWRARSVARVLREWSSVSRIFHHATRPVPLQNLRTPVDLRLGGRWGSGMIVGRVFPTPLSDHGVRVPVAGGPGVHQVRGRCRVAGIAARSRSLASPSQPATPLVAGSSGSLRVGPAAAATAADAPTGHAGHIAGLAPAPGSPQVAIPKPARPPIAEQADPRADLPARARESPMGISASTRRTPHSGLPAG
jgi:hypothetical protein